MHIEVLLQWAGCALGVAGSLLLALNIRQSGWGFALYLGSNVAWIGFGLTSGVHALAIQHALSQWCRASESGAGWCVRASRDLSGTSRPSLGPKAEACMPAEALLREREASPAVLTVAQLHAALSRCMEAHPPEGLELSLHADANCIAGLWGLMSYQRITSIPVSEVDAKVLEAFGRWRS